jgi:hypothetical protein
MRPIPREGRPGNSGSTLGRDANRAFACAIIDVLCRNQGNDKKEVREIEREVAHKIDEKVGALRSWRKALKAKKTGRARILYDNALATLNQQPDPPAAAREGLMKMIGLGR